jgi:drug/metabolite transporter (DMT)-like permease
MSNPKLKHWLLFALVTLIWGSSFILMKKGLVAFSFVQVACLRLFITMLALLPFLPKSFKHLKNPKTLIPVLIVSIIGSGIPPFLFTLAETQIPSAAAGILNGLTPLFVLLFGVLWFRMVFHWQKITGIIFGLTGAAILILFSDTVSSDGATTYNYWYGFYIVLASICYAISSNVVKAQCQDIPALELNGASFILLGPLAGAALFFTDFTTVLQTDPQAYTALGYIVILAVAGTAIAKVLFFKLTQETDALFSSMITYSLPIVAIFWGILDQEAIGMSYFIGLGLILLGVYLSSKNIGINHLPKNGQKKVANPKK